MNSPPQAVIIAGPNGSGKSTAATKLLPPDMTFINADLIAQELTGDTDNAGDINAGRILAARAHVLEKLREPFAFETTLATRMMANRVRRRYDAGLRNLFDIYMPLGHTWRIYDNSTLEPHLVAKGGDGRDTRVYTREPWSAIMERRNAINAG